MDIQAVEYFMFKEKETGKEYLMPGMTNCVSGSRYVITFFVPYLETRKAEVVTLVTHKKEWIEKWVRSNKNSTVSLTVESRPNPVHETMISVLILGTKEDCLIFQLQHINGLPIFNLLQRFLNTNLFVGFDMKEKVKKLLDDYQIEVSNYMDLKMLARTTDNLAVTESSTLRDLCQQILGMNFDKPERVSTLNWNALRLSEILIKYAAAEAHVTYYIWNTLTNELANAAID